MARTPCLRTLHVNTERTWRGGEKQALLLMEGLRDRGQEVELVCLPGSAIEERARAAGGIRVHARSLRGELNPLAIGSLRRVIQERRPVICHMHTSHAHTLGVLARGCARRPFTVVSRRVDFSIYRRGTLGLNWLKYRFGVDRYIAISEAIRDMLLADHVPAERLRVVHSGVPPLPVPERSAADLRAALAIRAGAPVVGTVAHLAEHKGQVHLVSALARLRTSHPSVHVVIVGEGEERPRLETLRAALGLAGHLHLVGFQQDVASFLALFDVFCMPSVQEGLCTSLLDALHQELPVVATRTGGIPEIIRHGETGLLVAPADPDALAGALAELLDDPARGRQLGRAGRALVETEFSVDRMVEGNLAVYEELVVGPR